MSFWKWLGEVSYTLEAAEATAEKKREARRKEKLEALKYTFANLVTLTTFRNDMSRLTDGISQLFAYHGELVVQRVTDRFTHVTSRYTSDLGAVINLKLDDVKDSLKDFISRGERLLLTNVVNTVSTIMAQYDKSSEQRQYATNAMVRALGDQARAHDLNETGRFVELLQRFQDLKQHVTDSVSSITGETTSGADTPRLEWLIENSDNVIELGDAMKALRDGTMPASAAMVHVVRAIRTMIPVDMRTAKRAMDVQAELWGVGQTELAIAA